MINGGMLHISLANSKRNSALCSSIDTQPTTRYNGDA